MLPLLRNSLSVGWLFGGALQASLQACMRSGARERLQPLPGARKLSTRLVISPQLFRRAGSLEAQSGEGAANRGF